MGMQVYDICVACYKQTRLPPEEVLCEECRAKGITRQSFWPTKLPSSPAAATSRAYSQGRITRSEGLARMSLGLCLGAILYSLAAGQIVQASTWLIVSGLQYEAMKSKNRRRIDLLPHDPIDHSDLKEATDKILAALNAGRTASPDTMQVRQQFEPPAEAPLPPAFPPQSKLSSGGYHNPRPANVKRPRPPPSPRKWDTIPK